MVKEVEIAKTPADVRRQIAADANRICYIIYEPISPLDKSRVDIYVIHVDSKAGPFRGLGSTCVTKFESIGENLVPPHHLGPVKDGCARLSYSQAASAAGERVERLRGGQGVSLSGASACTILSSYVGISA